MTSSSTETVKPGFLLKMWASIRKLVIGTDVRHDNEAKSTFKPDNQGNGAVKRPNTLLENLVSQVVDSSATLTNYLDSNKLPQPGFRYGDPTQTVPDGAPDNVRLSCQQLMESALRIYQLALGPKEYIPTMAITYQYISCLRWLSAFNIFDLVPLDKPITYSELASAADVSERQLKVVARMSMTDNLFYEPNEDSIAHTAASALIATNPGYLAWASNVTELAAPACLYFSDACKKWPDSLEKNETAYNLFAKTDLPFFDHLRTIPGKVEQFSKYMKVVQMSYGLSMDHLIKGYDWKSLGKATIVDVGGSQGSASIALAHAFDDLEFIVQDLDENAEKGRDALRSYGLPISSRITYQGHNFFEPQPFKGADVYFLRMILHDWAPKEATMILQNLVPALGPDSKIIIMDTVLPQSGSIKSTEERMLRARDLTMIQTFNSFERDKHAWQEIIESADSRLAIKSVNLPLGSSMSIIEVTFNG